MGSSIEETVRRGVDAFNRRDREAWDQVVDPELVNVPPSDWPEPAPIRGRDAVWDFWVAGNEPWDAGTFELADLNQIDEEHAVAHIRAEMKGRASGAEVTWAFWQLLTIRDGRFAQIEWYSDREQALAAAGGASVDEPHLE